jgi:hypothetical protein
MHGNCIAPMGDEDLTCPGQRRLPRTARPVAGLTSWAGRAVSLQEAAMSGDECGAREIIFFSHGQSRTTLTRYFRRHSCVKGTTPA